MSKKRIDSYFPKISNQDTTSSDIERPNNNGESSNSVSANLPESNEISMDSHRNKIPRIDKDSDAIERDPGLRRMIWDYSPNDVDQIRRAYIKHGPYQVDPKKFGETETDDGGRKFVISWYKLFPDWLEYSPTKKAAFCLQCFLFAKPSTVSGANTFVIDGFRAWKKVNNGKKCAFLTHEGHGPNSSHKICMGKFLDVKNSLQNIDKAFEKHSSESVANNRLRLRVSIDVAKLCAFQGIAFRGHNERFESKNRGNFIEIVKHTASYNSGVDEQVLENAPKNATYASPDIQKEILSIYKSKIQSLIRAEIGDAKFCIIVDESRDESKKEQMAIILRFVDKKGFVRERFFDIVHVEDTKASTLKKEICDVLSRHNLSVRDIRGQGYDCASNMRGEWNGLQALFLSECPYAYYIHCFAHRLQLILVATSQSTIPIENFFSHLNHIINVVDSSSKRHDQLQIAKAIQIVESIATDELETGRGKNQVGTLQRPGDTRWSSHFRSLNRLREMFDSVFVVLDEIINNTCPVSSRAAADGAYEVMMSFEFVFILHFLIELLGRTNDLCYRLQNRSLDIVNAMDAVANAKENIQKFRENGWDELFKEVKKFCEKRDIDIPDMNGLRRSSKGRARRSNPITLDHFYRIDLFTGTIDRILHEMNFRFNEDAVELLRLSSVFDPRDGYKSFNPNDIFKLVEKFYPADFTNQEKLHLKYQLESFGLDLQKNTNFQGISTLSRLCEVLSTTRKSIDFNLIDRLIRLLLTLPVSTATSERAFSAMKIVKTRLRTKMEDNFLSSVLIMHIEKEIARSIDVDSIIDEFDQMKHRRAQFKTPR